MPGNAPNNDVLNWNRVGRALPQKLVDTTPAPGRAGAYGEAMVQLVTSRDLTYCDEGSEFQT